jgi:hypothetical protein
MPDWAEVERQRAHYEPHLGEALHVDGSDPSAVNCSRAVAYVTEGPQAPAGAVILGGR